METTVLEKISAVLTEHRETLGGFIALAEIVTNPQGHEQPSDVPGIETEWVDQRGDEAGGVPYHGDVYVELERGRWGRFEYHT